MRCVRRHLDNLEYQTNKTKLKIKTLERIKRQKTSEIILYLCLYSNDNS